MQMTSFRYQPPWLTYKTCLVFLYMQGANLDILFNVSKSYLFVVGNIYKETLPHIHINGMQISWTDSLKYLGVNFISGKRLNVGISPVMRKFYAAANSVVLPETRFYSFCWQVWIKFFNKLECAFTNRPTVWNECAYLCRNSADWKQL